MSEELKPNAPETKPKRRWFKFSMRTLLVLMTVLCVWLGLQVNAARRQKEAVDAILKAGGQFNYDYQLTPTKRGRWDVDYDVDSNAEPSAPVWLRKLFGDDFFRDVSGCGIHSGTISESELNLFARFSGLKAVDLSDDVKVISADSPTPRPINDLDIAPLGRLKNLQFIAIKSSTINGSFLEQMASSERLTGLSLQSKSFTDDMMKHLQNLKELRQLDLRSTSVSDDGLPFLRQMTKLKSLELNWTKVTSEGIRELQKSLPNCKIHGP